MRDRDRELDAAVAAERARIYQEVVEPLVEALEGVLDMDATNVLRHQVSRGVGSATADGRAIRAGLAALATARKAMEER